MNVVTAVMSMDHETEAWIVIGVFQDQSQNNAFQSLNSKSLGFLQKLLDLGNFTGILGQTQHLFDVLGIHAPGVLLVGLGQSTLVSPCDFRKAISAGVAALKEANVSSAKLFLADIPIHDRDILWAAQACTQIFLEQPYSYREAALEKKDPTPSLEQLILIGESDQETKIQQGIKRGRALADAANFSRRLADTPANICTPSWLALQAQSMAVQYDLHCQILCPDEMRALGMHLLLGVAQGSRQEPRLIVLKYNGASKARAPAILIGKGVTFDAGGISLKPALNMDRLKYDMSGGAAVLGAIQAAASLKLPVNVMAIVPATENLPGGQATKPGDVHRGMNGLTVEVLNTDAEGRLILADALAYAEQFKPDIVIDTATLTRARFVALGAHASALYSNDPSLMNQIQAAGEETLDRVWPMPLWPEYHEQLKSQFADLANIGGEGGGSITAACFLSRFAENYRWAHLDGGGMSGEGPAGIARHVPLLVTFLIHYAEQAVADSGCHF